MLIILHGGQIVCTVTSQQEALKILALRAHCFLSQLPPT